MDAEECCISASRSIRRQKWTGQQIVEAFWEGESKTYVIRDRDKIYGEEFRRGLRSLSMKEVISGFQSPWQNANVEWSG